MSFRIVKSMSLISRASKELSACNVRSYGRWMHRHPSKVFMKSPNLKEETVIDLDPEILKQNRDETKNVHDKFYRTQKSHNLAVVKHNKKIPEKIGQTPNNQDSEESTTHELKLAKNPIIVGDKEELNAVRNKKVKYVRPNEKAKRENVFDESGDIIYEKLKNNDPRISILLTKLKSKKERLLQKQVMVEGWRMILDGLSAKCKLRYLIFSRTDDLEVLKPYLPKTGLKLFKIPYKEIELWSEVETPSGIIGVFETPHPESMPISPRSLPIELVCDNIRVPGNLGAILRASLGAGIRRVFLTKGCVDLWDSKVLRSAAGAHFRLPIESALEWQEIKQKIEPESSVFIADSNSKVILSEGIGERKNVPLNEQKSNLADLSLPVVPYYSVEYGTLPGVTLIVGGETEGVSEESYRFAASRNGLRLNIPLEHGVDSLNTGMATAVIAFEIKKKVVEARLAARLISNENKI